MKKIASDELKEFLQDWLNWAEGRESKHGYIDGIGLCSSAHRFSDDQSINLHDEISILFDYNDFPFGEREYFDRAYDGTQHQDPNRLAWVKAALNDTLDTWELME